MGVVLSCSSDAVLAYSSPSHHQSSHISSKSRNGREKNTRFALSSVSDNASSYVDAEQSVSFQGGQYNYSSIRTSTSGPGSLAINSCGSAQSETVTSPLRPVCTAKIKIAAIAEFYPEFKKMVIGRLDDEMEISLEKRVIYLYNCAYHTDSIAERDALQNNVYPWVREYCRERGCTVEVIDLSWNLKDFYASGHACRKLPLPILKELLKNRSDCSVVTVMLNEKYGSYWIPLEIEEQDFNMIFKKVTEDEKEFLEKWYKLSQTLEPPSYILQAVELYSDKYSGSSEVFKEGLREWEKQHLRLRNIMIKATPPGTNKLCHTSDIEKDLEETLLSDVYTCNKVIYIHRKLTNMHLDDAIRYPQLEHFIDITGDHLNEIAQAKLKELINRISEKVDEDRRIELEVPWLALVNIDTKPQHSIDYVADAAPSPDNTSQKKRFSIPDTRRRERRNSQAEGEVLTGDATSDRRRSSALLKRKIGKLKSRENSIAIDDLGRNSVNSNSVENFKDRQQYLQNFSDAYQLMVKDMVDEAVVKLNAKSAKRAKMISRGLTSSLYSDLLHHSRVAMECRFKVLGQNEFVQQLESFVVKGNGGSENKSYPVLVHGATGIGKTSLVSLLAANVFSLDKWKNCVCVMRFARASKTSMTIDQTVYSIAEQLCILAGLSLRTISKHKEKILHHLLSVTSPKIPSSNTLIIIDGVDQLEIPPGSLFEGFSWLPKELPGSVRMILTATSSSDVCRNIRDHMSPNTHCMEIPRLFPADQFAILDSFLQRCQRTMSEEAQMRICQQIQPSGSPLLIQIITICLLHFSTDEDSAARLNISNDIQTMISVLLGLIEKQFGVNYVTVLCCLMISTKFGVSQSEFLDIASCHEGTCNEALVLDHYTVRRVPCLQWYALTSTLRPFLYFHESHGTPLCQWRHVAFEQVCQKRYAQCIPEVNRLLQQYWSSELDPDDFAHVAKQPLRFDSGIYNGRLFDEKLHSFQLSPSAADDCGKLFNSVFIQGLLESSSTRTVLMELDLLPMCEELLVFRKMLERLEPALYISKQSFLTHLYKYITWNNIDTESNFPVLHQLYQEAAKRLPPILQSVYGLGSFTFGYSPDKYGSKYNNTGIFRIKGDEEHVVVIAQHNNEVKIFNFHTELNHRVLRDVEVPRDVQVINMFRAVILCNRQLHIYDLDKGKLFSKLRGILNLRMPYFGIHDEEHTMALSRDRMYVNMLHNITGEVVTTFKVGEDRFLNSLLVSDNGDICVCGDEVQKPFPLLVWNLKHRKLIHDFRIRGHEFLTRMASITKNGQIVVTVCREVEDPEPNFLIAYDLQNGSMLTKLKPEHSCTAVKISQEAGIIVSCHENGDVLVWKLGDSSVSHLPRSVMKGHTVGADQLLLSDSGSRGVTYDTKARDPFIWMWDFKRGVALGCIPSVTGPSSCQISADGRVVIVAFPDQETVHTFYVPSEEFVPNVQSVYGDSARKGKVFHVD